MTAVTGCSFDCHGADQQAFRVAMTQTIVIACADHRAYLEGQGVTLVPVERRVEAVPVERDRRRFVAPWRRNAAAKDLTGATR